METMKNAEAGLNDEVKQEKMAPQETAQKPAEPKSKVAVKTVEGFLAGFVNNTLGDRTKYNNYSLKQEGDIVKLIYTAYSSSFNHAKQVTEMIVDGTDELAVRLACGLVLSNANRLEYCGTHLVFGGPRSYAPGQVPAQAMLQKAGAIPVPFRVFAEAKLNLAEAEVIEKAPSETITVVIKKWKNNGWVDEDETRHYVGACLLKVGVEYFLFDIDRNELVHKMFNPFIVKLPGNPKTIAEAYASLKPAKVTMAEIGGVSVQRQGEWFFIHRMDNLPPLPEPPKELKDLADNPPDARQMGGTANAYYEPGRTYCYTFIDKAQEMLYDQKVKEWQEAVEKVSGFSPREGELRQGNNRPNRVEKFLVLSDVVLVSGLVRHTGREHKDINLAGWWEAVPNTAVASWQVTGDID
ncbi:MAG: hypothetical protein A2X34_09725 [Elusimicrobia bacterium GWC2_51_8]|nr:MAG: hypothetical protein A2X33_10175 [Elusimicrobia bacterium GWA2_51_34]OGR61143.1 MAG: hypothetical protein A2X34_09725 [Elusimicrobia bacterium GWC2_51_8]OGR84729.1 MAG: hypothetical protein A2021_03890 [Elusimicrobia bacterium GWF2_52_66]